MIFFEKIFARKRKTEWVELDTIYTTRRLEFICIFLMENNIPYKVRAASTPLAANVTSYPGASAGCMWHLAVRPCNAARVQHYINTECDY